MAKRTSVRADSGVVPSSTVGEREGARNPIDVAAWIREGIRRGRLVPGQRLVEIDLVRDTGASRTRVREAFQRLGAEGLISIEEFRGASVRRISPEELSALYGTRAVLEGLAAAECARHGTDDDRERLTGAQHDLDAAIASGDHEAFARHNDRWHEAVIVGSRNPYVAQFVGHLAVPVSRLLLSTFHNRQRIDRANADHQAITAAILAQRADDAERLMRLHIQTGFAALMAQENNS